MYNKKNAEECILRKHNLKTIPKLFLDKKEKNIEEKVLKFFEENKYLKEYSAGERGVTVLKYIAKRSIEDKKPLIIVDKKI